MRFLVIEPLEEEVDASEQFRRDLLLELEREIGQTTARNVDAGPGASWPAIFFTVASTVAVSLALFNAPAVIQNNLPKWKAIFDKMAGLFSRRGLMYCVDSDTAKKLALFYVLNKTSGGYETLEIVSAVRHSWNNFPRYEDVSKAVSAEEKSQFDANVEAVDLARSRHIIFVSVDNIGYSVIIETDGYCSYLASLGPTSAE